MTQPKRRGRGNPSPSLPLNELVTGTEAIKALMDGSYIRNITWTEDLSLWLYLDKERYCICVGRLQDSEMTFYSEYSINAINHRIFLKRKNWVIVEPDTVTSEFINALKKI